MTNEYIVGLVVKADTPEEAKDLVEDTFYFLEYDELKVKRSVDYMYIMRNMERKDWENNILRKTLLVLNVKLHVINALTNNEEWMAEMKKRGYY